MNGYKQGQPTNWRKAVLLRSLPFSIESVHAHEHQHEHHDHKQKKSCEDDHCHKEAASEGHDCCDNHECH